MADVTRLYGGGSTQVPGNGYICDPKALQKGPGRLCEIFHKGYIPLAEMAENPEKNPVGRGFGVGYGIMGAGFQLAFSILFFAGLGYLADKKLGTTPWLLLLGLLVGLGAGFYAFWRRVVAAADGRSGAQTHK